MNSGLCLQSRINRRSVGLVIVVSLSEPRCWQGNLPSCPHMPSLYLGHFSALCSILPKQTFHFLEGLRSARSQSPSGSLPVHFDCSLGQGGAGRGAAPGLVTDVNLSLALRLDQEVSALHPAPQQSSLILSGLMLVCFRPSASLLHFTLSVRV